jgi:hypothetical protein
MSLKNHTTHYPSIYFEFRLNTIATINKMTVPSITHLAIYHSTIETNKIHICLGMLIYLDADIALWKLEEEVSWLLSGMFWDIEANIRVRESFRLR